MQQGAARGNQNPGEESLSINELIKIYPKIIQVLDDLGVQVNTKSELSLNYLCTEAGVEPKEVFNRLLPENEEKISINSKIESISIIPGNNKSGKKEWNEKLDFHNGDVIAIVGATGSGKSQLLNDIEGLVQGDSPTGRHILLNNATVDIDIRLKQWKKPIAQISQNMNYILDLEVGEFLEIHCQSKNIVKTKKLKKEVVETACSLCGEPFTAKTNIVNLSGGQSRALMIADALKISNAPVLLVDEIENAGIDRKQAINLLLNNNNITLIATHDPLIALMAHKRIILKNGGIYKIMKRTEDESLLLEKLLKENERSNQLKKMLRNGDSMSLSLY